MFRRCMWGLVKIAGLAVFTALGGACAAAPVEPVTLRYSFQDGLEGWDSRAGVLPAGLAWSINQVAEPAFEGRGSIRFSLDATDGEGAVWVQKQFPITIGKDDLVSARISLQARVEAVPAQQPQLVFWARGSAPFDRNSFTGKEPVALTEAWNEYVWTERVQTSGKGLWFAFGIEVPQGGAATVNIDEVVVEVTR
ncbi:MAG: hypothetical protein HYY01_01940 [Chloroflexi bacterium]|nr:hypothetical protein [Chloroflexota bacterium]